MSHHRRHLLLAVLLTATATGAAAGTADAAPLPAAGTVCPGTFQVEHNDHIGRLALPAGPYAIKIQAPGLSCNQASARFSAFLQDFDGKLPSPWAMNAHRRLFEQQQTGAAFSVAPTSSGVPVPPGPPHTTGEGRRCAGTFQVEHNDRIGRLALPAGPYQITLGASKPVTCARSSQEFAAFLARPDGKLPRPWTMQATSGTFSRDGIAAFRIKPAV